MASFDSIVLSWNLLANLRTVKYYLDIDLSSLSRIWQRCIVATRNAQYAHKDHINSHGS